MASAALDPKTEYWATLPAERFCAAAFEKVKEWDYYFYSSPLYKRMRTCARFYNGTDDEGFTSSQVGTKGSQNQLSMLKANHVRPIVQNVLAMTTSQRPSVKPVAKTTDAESQAQTLLASNRYDYYMSEEGVEEKIAEVEEMALVLSMGTLMGRWDENLGEVITIDPETGRRVRQGDISFSTHLPFDVIGDPTRHDSDHPWRMVRSYKSRFELAAEHPDLAQRIVTLQMEPDVARMRFDLSADFRRERRMETDQIPVYEYFHRDSAAVPGGRYFKFLSADVFLTVDPPAIPNADGSPSAAGWSPLPYDDIPLHELMPARMFGTMWGYTSIFDILAMQQGVDTLTSIPITNQKTLGVQALLMPAGHTFNISRVVEGFPVLEYDAKIGKPEAIQWVQTAPEIFTFRKDLIAEMGQIGGGLSEVSRGMEQKDLSGAAMAMQDATAQRYNSNFQRGVSGLTKWTAMFIIRTLQRYVKEPRKALMSGGQNSSLARDFTGDDLNLIQSVTVEEVNPLFKTTSGRLQVASDLMDKGAISGKQYIGIIDTGKLEVATEAPEMARINIKRENEDLASGMPCIVSQTDLHAAHIQEHKGVLDSQEARKNPQVYAAVMDHIETHIFVWNDTDPVINAMIGNGPPPGPPIMGWQPQQGSMSQGLLAPGQATMPPGMPSSSPGNGAPGPQAPQQGPNLAGPAVQAPGPQQPPNMPHMPKNPATGQPWTPNGGMK